MNETVGKIYAALAGVQADLAAVGIGKDGWNEAQKFHFRGIDAIHDALAPILVKNKVIVVPSVIERVTSERARSGKDPLHFVTVQAHYSMISTEDGTELTAGPFYGEAMDSADKATNKAMSIAYKYWAIQTFSIPLVGHDDPDADGGSSVEMPVDRINAIIDGLKKATSKAQLRTFFAKAVEEAESAGDRSAFKRFKEEAEKLAAALPEVAEPRAKGEAEKPAEQPKQSDEPKASPALLKMLRTAIDKKGVDIEGLAEITGGIAIEDLNKSQAASALKKVEAL